MADACGAPGIAHASSTDRSVGPDAHVVAGRVVAANPERGASAAAGHDRAPDRRRAAPRDLRVVAAGAGRAAAGVGARVVERALPDPGAHHVGGGPPGAAAPAEEVLPVGPVRVDQRAVLAPRRRAYAARPSSHRSGRSPTARRAALCGSRNLDDRPLLPASTAVAPARRRMATRRSAAAATKGKRRGGIAGWFAC